MLIEQGEYVYPFFNAYFVQNMLSLAMYSIVRGYVPHFDLNGREAGYTNWDTFFKQPFGTERTQCTTTNDRQRGYYTYWLDMAWKPRELRRWCRAYEWFVHPNDATRQYIEADYQATIQGKKHILGVLCRGTDYTTLQPKGHPRQPTVEQVIEKVQEQMQTEQYEAIYLATEDQRIAERFEQAFPGRVLTNRREYFDKAFETLYRQDQRRDITDVNLHRDDANYWRSIQYLSSMAILSRCEALVAGNCGGTCLALLMNNMHYRYTYIFNLGMYA